MQTPIYLSTYLWTGVELGNLSYQYVFDSISVKGEVLYPYVYTCATTRAPRPLFVASNWDELDLHGVFFLVSDGNAAGTGPGDPWTGGSGGVQPPYSGYAPPHLAQPAYPMHLPHDPMVRPPSLVPFLPPSLRFASISPSPFSFRLIRPSLITRPPPFVANSSPLPDCC